MKVGVIGSRDFHDYALVKKILGGINNIDLIVSGGAAGADTLGECYADENKINTLIFKPDWKKYGKGAGFVRNKTIIENSDVVVAFWDGESKGTANSIETAKKLNKKSVVVINGVIQFTTVINEILQAT